MKNTTYLKKMLDKVNIFIDQTNLRTVLLTTLTIIISIFCITKTVKVRFLQHGTGVVDIYIPKDSLLAISQDVLVNTTVTQDNPKTQKKKVKLSKETKIIQEVSKLAQQEAKIYNIPASIKVAQSALESGWGEDEIVKRANNYYGLKNKHTSKPIENKLISGNINHKTNEYYNNVKITKYADFCVYESRWASFRHHSIFLRDRIDTGFNEGYARMQNLSPKDYKGWAQALEDSNYSTDPQYAEKLIDIIERHKLYKLD